MSAAVSGRPRWRKWSEQTRRTDPGYTHYPLVPSRRGQTYVAEIIGTDERFVFKRIFADPLIDRRGRGARARIPLTCNGLYEIQHWPEEQRTRLHIHVSAGRARQVDSVEAHRIARTIAG